MIRTFTLVLTGVVSGILVFTAVSMLLSRDQAGDTPSPELAVTLLACAIVVVTAGVAVAMAWQSSRALSLVVGIAGVIAGFGGLAYFLLASLLTAGFPDVLLQPLNLTIALVMAVIGLMGIGLLMRRSDLATTAGTTGPWPVRSWHPVASGIAIGVTAAWIWSAIVYSLIPYECCLARG